MFFECLYLKNYVLVKFQLKLKYIKRYFKNKRKSTLNFCRYTMKPHSKCLSSSHESRRHAYQAPSLELFIASYNLHIGKHIPFRHKRFYIFSQTDWVYLHADLPGGLFSCRQSIYAACRERELVSRDKLTWWSSNSSVACYYLRGKRLVST